MVLQVWALVQDFRVYRKHNQRSLLSSTEGKQLVYCMGVGYSG